MTPPPAHCDNAMRVRNTALLRVRTSAPQRFCVSVLLHLRTPHLSTSACSHLSTPHLSTSACPHLSTSAHPSRYELSRIEEVVFVLLLVTEVVAVAHHHIETCVALPICLGGLAHTLDDVTRRCDYALHLLL